MNYRIERWFTDKEAYEQDMWDSGWQQVRIGNFTESESLSEALDWFSVLYEVEGEDWADWKAWYRLIREDGCVVKLKRGKVRPIKRPKPYYVCFWNTITFDAPWEEYEPDMVWECRYMGDAYSLMNHFATMTSLNLKEGFCSAECSLAIWHESEYTDLIEI